MAAKPNVSDEWKKYTTLKIFKERFQSKKRFVEFSDALENAFENDCPFKLFWNGMVARLFDAIMHRQAIPLCRSRSLRERTGVDQRLERLPSGPPPGPKSFPYTVVPGTNTDKRFVLISRIG
uniref:Uncharacterized protein n=1 Tax=Parascaris equorum TaxID=6256 RepID=A0A914S3P5_PAREQ